jgi:hypothetical protein
MRSTSASFQPGSGDHAVEGGAPSVRVPVLSTIRVSTLRSDSIAAASRNSTPWVAALPVATITTSGVARPKRAGAGDDQHRHRIDEAVGPARLRVRRTPSQKVRSAMATTPSTNQPATTVGHALHGRARALGLRDHLHDLGEHRLCADLLGDA